MLAKQVSTPQLGKPMLIRQKVKSSQSVKPQPNKRGNLCRPQVCHTGDVAQVACPKAKGLAREVDGRVGAGNRRQGCGAEVLG